MSWEKFTNYFEVEPRWVDCRKGCPIASVEDLVAACDENTIGERPGGVDSTLAGLSQLLQRCGCALSYVAALWLCPVICCSAAAVPCHIWRAPAADCCRQELVEHDLLDGGSQPTSS